MNKALLIGRATRDPEVKEVNGSMIASFGLATNKKYTTKAGEKKEMVEFHNCTAWGKLADIIGKYVRKGHQLFVSGEIRTRSWEKDGQTHYSTEIRVEDMEMLTPKGSKGPKHPDGSPATDLPRPEDYAAQDDINLEDIPL